MKRSASDFSVAIAILGLSSGTLASDRWTTEIQGGAPHEMRLTGALPNADGTLLLALNQRAPSDVPYWQARIDEAGNTIAIDRNDEHRFPYRRHGTQWSQFHHHGGGLEISMPLTPFSCTRERDWLGMGTDYRRFTSEIRPQVGFGDDIGRLDADGGHFGTYFLEQTLTPPAYTARFARDCSHTRVLDAGVTTLRNVPNAAAAYGFFAGKLVRLEAGGIRWEWAIPAPAGDWRTSLGGVTDDGDAIIVFSSAVGPIERVIVSVDADGAEQWRHAMTGGAELHVASEADTTWLWTSGFPYEGDRSSASNSLLAIADDGTRGEPIDLGVARLSRLLHGNMNAPPSWVLSPAGAPDSRYVVLEAHGVTVQEILRTEHRPMARFTSGSVAALGPGDSYGAFDLRVLSVSGGERIVPLPTVRRIELGSVDGDAHGSLVLTYESEKLATVTAQAADGTLQWTSQLPPMPDALPEFALARPRLRANAANVCVLWNFKVACLRRLDGNLLHDWKTLPEGTLSAVLLPPGNDETRVLVRHCQRPPPDCIVETRAIHLDMQGNAIDSTAVPGPWYETSMIEGDDGAVGWYLDEYSSTQITVLDAQLGLAWTAQFADQATLAALGSSGVAYVGTSTELIKFASDGSVVWRAAWPEGVIAWAASGIELPDGDVIVTTGQEPIHRMRLRAEDGQPIWHRSGIENGWATGSPYDWVLSDDGVRVLRRPRADAISSWWPSGQRVLAIDLATGELLAAHAAAEVADIYSRKRFDAHVFADGSVLRAVDSPSRGTIVVKRSLADLTASADQRIDASLLGAWFSPDTTGQGLFLDVDGARAYGGWFTYTPTGGHNAEALQWYTLVQPRSANGSVVDFDIYASRDGSFDGNDALSSKVGSARLRRIHCDRAMLSYRFDDGFEGVLPLVRAVSASRSCNGLGDDAQASDGIDPRSSGAWHDPGLSGQGLAFDVRPGLFAGAWFTFTPGDSRPHWFTLSGPVTAADGTIAVSIFRTMGGRFDTAPTNNTERIGTATIRFTTCETAIFDFSFDDTDVAQVFRGRQGRMEIQRVLPCLD